MTFDLLEFATLIIAGFTSCAEFGSYAFVHPVIRNLPAEYHVEVEKGTQNLRPRYADSHDAVPDPLRFLRDPR
jgi:hypothetical protein